MSIGGGGGGGGGGCGWVFCAQAGSASKAANASANPPACKPGAVPARAWTCAALVSLHRSRRAALFICVPFASQAATTRVRCLQAPRQPDGTTPAHLDAPIPSGPRLKAPGPPTQTVKLKLRRVRVKSAKMLQDDPY